VSVDQQRRRSSAADDPEPDCSRTNADWEPEPATGGLLAFHPPCQRCFPDDGPDEGETVLRSRGTHGNRVHRPADGGDR
jgi:hypothetical protein